MKASTMLAVIFFAMVFTVVVLAPQLPTRAKFAPLLVGIPGLVLILIIVLRETLTKELQSDKDKSSAEANRLVIRLKQFGSSYSEVALSLAGLVAGIYVMGLLIGICLFIFLYLKLHHVSWLMSVLQSVIAFAVVYGIFQSGLGIILYKGILFG